MGNLRLFLAERKSSRFENEVFLGGVMYFYASSPLGWTYLRPLEGARQTFGVWVRDSVYFTPGKTMVRDQ